jgi:uncharacterized protein YeaO (DUF488 family)
VKAHIGVRRIYSAPSSTDGYRILVDRIWPRGVAKDKAAVDLWLKEIAPSAALRKWFAHDPARWAEFLVRYHRELALNPDSVAQIRGLAKKGAVTLVYAARDEQHNNAVALQLYLAA